MTNSINVIDVDKIGSATSPLALAKTVALVSACNSTKAGDVVSKTRTAAARQAGSIQAAVEAGKKAYVEEKRKTELSGRTEAAPTYTPEKSM